MAVLAGEGGSLAEKRLRNSTHLKTCSAKCAFRAEEALSLEKDFVVRVENNFSCLAVEILELTC